MNAENPFDDLEATLAKSGIDGAYAKLSEVLRSSGRFHDLFDVRLMQGRRKFGLPPAPTTGLDDLPEADRSRMEEVYLDACREVGGLLLENGKPREAWMYLRPTGEKGAIAKRLRELADDESQRQHVIELALHEGICPRLGFELVLKHYGLCNAISMFDAEMHRRPKSDRQEVARLLLNQIHADLTRGLIQEITRKRGSAPPETTIEGLVAERDWLFADNDYHVDTSHLAAITRFSLTLEDPADLRKAIDLTEYGRRLSPQYQFAGQEPFGDVYPTHALFFRALLGEGVDEAIEYFGGRAKELGGTEAGLFPAEIYVGLLSRLGRHEAALEAAAELIPLGAPSLGFAPSLFDSARSAGKLDRYRGICRERDDLLGFVSALAESRA